MTIIFEFLSLAICKTPNILLKDDYLAIFIRLRGIFTWKPYILSYYAHAGFIITSRNFQLKIILAIRNIPLRAEGSKKYQQI